MLRRWLAPPRRRGALALAALSGVLYSVGFCGFEQFYLAWICLVPVLWALDDDNLSRKEAVVLGWVAGCVAHLGAYTWLIHMLRVFGYLPLPLAVLGYFLLCLAQSSLFAAWGWGMHWLVQRRGVPWVWAAPAMMVVAEWIYPALFPSYLANSQYRQTWLIQGLDLVGPLGLTYLLCLGNAVAYQILAWGLRRRGGFPRAATALFVVLLVGDVLYGYGRIADLDDTLSHADRTVAVGLVQANMGIYEKSENPEEGLRRHRDQSLELQAQGAQLIVWPESGYYYAIYEGTHNVKNEVLGSVRTPILFGGLRASRGQEGREIFNTAFLADADGRLLGSYDKTYLLAFGEYLPLGEALSFLYKLSPQTSHFTRGSHTTPLEVNGVRYGVLICYEDILPGFVRTVMQNGPDVLVNLTNDAWFGRTHEPLIHLALATFRAVEHRRYLLRATNTGISAIVDPAGRITAQTPVFTRANLLGNVLPMQGTTVYQTLGDATAMVCAGLVFWWSRMPVWRVGRGLVARVTALSQRGAVTTKPNKKRRRKS